MKIMVNGEDAQVSGVALLEVLAELGYGDETIATAVNETFVPVGMRAATVLAPGDRLEIVAPRQGG